jgi:hypothetical protein
MHENVTPSKGRHIVDHLIDREPDRGVVRGDDGASADADHDVHWNLMTEDLPEHSEVRRASKASGAQYDPDANAVRSGNHVKTLSLRADAPAQPR